LSQERGGFAPPPNGLNCVEERGRYQVGAAIVGIWWSSNRKPVDMSLPLRRFSIPADRLDEGMVGS